MSLCPHILTFSLMTEKPESSTAIPVPKVTAGFASQAFGSCRVSLKDKYAIYCTVKKPIPRYNPTSDKAVDVRLILNGSGSKTSRGVRLQEVFLAERLDELLDKKLTPSLLVPVSLVTSVADGCGSVLHSMYNACVVALLSAGIPMKSLTVAYPLSTSTDPSSPVALGICQAPRAVLKQQGSNPKSSWTLLPPSVDALPEKSVIYRIGAATERETFGSVQTAFVGAMVRDIKKALEGFVSHVK